MYTSIINENSEVTDTEKLLKVLTDPVSNRILQMIRVNKKMTISDILSANTKVPRATLYRKIDKMLEVGAIYVASTNKVRGQTENVYAIRNNYISNSETGDNGMKLVTINLMQILDLYDRYFRNENADVSRDKLFMMNYAISLSDKDFSDMLSELLKIIDKYQRKRSSDDSKIRNLYLLSAPIGESYE